MIDDAKICIRIVARLYREPANLQLPLPPSTINLMQKQNGFSLLELLVVTGIVALLASISIPNFSRMQSKANFESEVDTIFDQLLEVRMNALTGKMCAGLSSEKWTFEFDITTDKSTVSCENSGGTVLINTHDILWQESHSIDLDNTPATSAQIEFLPDTAQALIPDGTDQRTDAKFLLNHSSGAQKTVCFNRIMGIPQLSDGDIDCTP